MFTSKEIKHIQAAKITPEFLKSPQAAKAASEGIDMGLKISDLTYHFKDNKQ